MKCVILVSCVGKKVNYRTRAAEIYISSWFRLARKLVEESGHPWYILSAEHGLLDPDKEIKPYDKTLSTMSRMKRRQWAQRVQQQMDGELPDADKAVILAGENYREHLMPYLNQRYSTVNIPMHGLKIGEQLKWLKNAQAKDLCP